MAAVVDKSVLTLADEKTFRGMPTHYYLSTEIQRPEELEYADFLVSSHPKAPEALDLLLGTQGWRRFAEQNPEEFRKKHKEDADRLLLTMGQPTPVEVDLAKQEVQQFHDEYVARLDSVANDRRRLQASLAEVQNPKGILQAEIQSANESIAQETKRVETASRAYSDHWELLDVMRPYVLRGMALIGLALLLTCLLLGIAKGWRRGWAYYGLVGGVGIVAAVLVIANSNQFQWFLFENEAPLPAGHYHQKNTELARARRDALPEAPLAPAAMPARPEGKAEGKDRLQKEGDERGGMAREAFGRKAGVMGMGGGLPRPARWWRLWWWPIRRWFWRRRYAWPRPSAWSDLFSICSRER